MYIRLTSRCNMTCDHCCYNCTHEGEDMNENTFRHVMGVCKDYGEEFISFGGGEPTMHPRFFEFLRIAMIQYDFSVWLASNGSIKEAMLRLARIMDEEDYITFEDDYDPDDDYGYSMEIEQKMITPTREYQLSVDLSTDYWHDRDMVDDRVWDMWNKRENSHKHSPFGLRDVSRMGAIKAGRAADTGVYSKENECVCPGLLVEPDGTVKACGCDDAPSFGKIWEMDVPENWQTGECHKEQEDNQ